MAVQIEKPRRPVNVVLRSFARQSVQQLQTDFAIQHIWPTEIYPGFAQVNAERKRRGQWYATGRGINSFQYEVSTAGGNHTIRVEFLDYLRFVDMGTAGGRSVEDVRRERKARYNRRYVKIWDAGDGQSHRPSIMREMRHLATRMQTYLTDFYGMEVNAVIYKSFANIESLNMNL